MPEHERDDWKHLQYFITKGVDKNVTKKSNLSKITINTNNTKTKNKKVNKLKLTVRLHENLIKTKINSLVARGAPRFMLVLPNVNGAD